MDITDFIKLAAQEPPLPFLIIGGYAVGAHGHTRATFDVDFLVRAADRETWLGRLIAAGLKLFAQTKSFAQFSQPSAGDGLDLIRNHAVEPNRLDHRDTMNTEKNQAIAGRD